ncbi:MAG: hypothetical protein ACJ8EL_16190 [Rhizomicrobium sp.]
MNGKRRVTVGEFLERWLSDWASVNVSGKTGELVRCHIVPHIGNTPVQKLRPVHLSGLYHERSHAPCPL